MTTTTTIGMVYSLVAVVTIFKNDIKNNKNLTISNKINYDAFELFALRVKFNLNYNMDIK